MRLVSAFTKKSEKSLIPSNENVWQVMQPLDMRFWSL